MNKKYLALIVAVVVLGGVVWWVLQPKPAAETMDISHARTSSEKIATNKVVIKDFAFTPSKITVKKGTTVTWTNDETASHGVVADSAANTGGLPTSASLFAKGQSVSHTFNTAGTFTYHCPAHPSMTGSVEVTE